jgi:hypothetical protein
VRRLRAGEWLGLAGAAALFVVLFVPWFDLAVRTRVVERAGRLLLPGLHRSGWSALGWPVVALLLVAMAATVWLAVATMGDGLVSQAMAAAVAAALAGTLALVVLLVRVTVAQPGLGVGAPDALVSARLAAYLGLAACAAMAAGAWWAMADERTDAPESAYTPPAPRPAPPPRG